MKTLPITLFAILGLGLLTSTSRAQPILDRVEKLLRDQVNSAKAPTAAVEPGYLGLIGNDTPEAKGVQVLQVLAGQPASTAGVRVGDLITSIDNQPIRTMDDMAQAIAGKAPGTKLAISVTRADQPQQLELTIGRRPGAPAVNEELPIPPQPAAGAAGRPRLGVRTLAVSETVRQQNNLPTSAGAQVISVTVGSAAERAAIPLGAVVTAVDGAPVASPNQFAAAISAAQGSAVELTYVHRGQPVRRKITLDGPPVAAAGPQPEVRARPPIVEAPAPADTPQPAKTPQPPKPSLFAEEKSPDRVAALEQRLQELEARIKSLEAELAKEKAAPEGEQE